MKTTFALLLLIVAASSVMAADTKETRCGWFNNPSPADADLIDRDGEWNIATQGMHQATGDWPEFNDAQRVMHGVASYGHGCACITGTFNHETNEVSAITKSNARPLSTCRKDKDLKNKEPSL